MSQKFDLVVIGGGPGGYVAAIRASQLGLKTALIEKEHLGGICLNWGCIPTKALLRSSEVLDLINHSSEFGIKVEGVSFDLKDMIDRSRSIAARLSSGVSMLLKKNKVSLFEGQGKIIDASKIHIQTKSNKKVEVESTHIIIATGARAKTFPNLQPDGDNIWTYKEAMVPKDLPKSILIVGSGAIGAEFCSFYKTLGVDVTLVEALENILPVEDLEISDFVRKSFTDRGIRILTNSLVNQLNTNNNGVEASITTKDKKESLIFDKVILAMGIVGNIEALGLEDLKVITKDSHIVTDEFSRTNIKNIYAIGDVTGAPWLAHKASHEGIVCVEKIAGHNPTPIDKSRIPGCTYCHPQVASIGYTEKRAKELGFNIKIGKFPFVGNGKAIALGDDKGLIKTIFNKETGELLGAHLVGSEVTELIQGFSIAKTLETTEAELMETVFPHPTLSEMMHESVLDAYNRVIHY
ncbi:MAG: dihydrolipoyl dehydrogenase [Pseudomonadota bacterium]|nr:dihydrolipoyl dehydrogenase [Pseudomonadota bacterium]